MTVGDRVSLRGYEVVATVQYDRGDLVLAHNNSTHYLIFDVESGLNPVYQNETVGELLYTRGYAHGGAKRSYQAALTWMVDRAVAWSSSLDEDAEEGAGR